MNIIIITFPIKYNSLDASYVCFILEIIAYQQKSYPCPVINVQFKIRNINKNTNIMDLQYMSKHEEYYFQDTIAFYE